MLNTYLNIFLMPPPSQVFFVMLNFLLAIIVDAFSEVKEQTQEGAHVPMELLHLAKDKWNALRNALNPKYISDSKVGVCWAPSVPGARKGLVT